MTELHESMSGDTPEYSPDLGLGEHVAKFREQLIRDLGYIVISEKALPYMPALHEGVYEEKLDRLREVTEQDIRTRRLQ